MSNPNILRLLKYGLYYPVAIFILLEAMLRFLGYRPYQHTDFTVSSHPSHAFTGHPTLGIQLNEGVFDITVNKHLTFQATHQPNGFRKVSNEIPPLNPDVLMLGCSYTYGYGVNDEENFTSLLQHRYPQVHFRNAGVIGHGTVQALLLLRDMLERDHPKLVLLNFSSYHLMRNTLSQQYRSHLKIGYNRASKSVQQQMASANFPYLSSCGGPFQQVAWSDIYNNWPGRESLASVYTVQKAYDQLLDDVDHQIAVTACLMREMARLCDEKGIAFRIVCINRSAATEKLRIQVSDMPWLEVGYSFSDTTMTNHPYDDHPNPKGHEFIANEIDRHLAPAFQQLSETPRSIQPIEVNFSASLTSPFIQ